MPRFPFQVSSDVPVFLAPMAGVSESPFRHICRRFGADVVVTEFLSAEGIRRENRPRSGSCAFEADERPIGIQIYGAEPDAMAEAAALVTELYQPDFIDINFGCPVKKVVQRNGGSGCLRDLDLVQTIIRAVARATHLPVTVKTRSGWNEELRDPVGIALRCRTPARGRSRCTPAPARRCTRARRTGTRSRAWWRRWRSRCIGNGDIKTAARRAAHAAAHAAAPAS